MPIIPFMIPGAEVAATGGVMVGRVEDLEAFCEQLRRHEESEPGFLDSLAKVVRSIRPFRSPRTSFQTA